MRGLVRDGIDSIKARLYVDDSPINEKLKDIEEKIKVLIENKDINLEPIYPICDQIDKLMVHFEFEKNHIMDILKVIETNFIGEQQIEFALRKHSDDYSEITYLDESCVNDDTFMERATIENPSMFFKDLPDFENFDFHEI